MTRLELNAVKTSYNSIVSPNFAARVISPPVRLSPVRLSIGQTLAGKGKLVFEGELLEFPLQWHPEGTRH